jgi:ubiquinone/menaquinone biosynthesis C-methylase UbiE
VAPPRDDFPGADASPWSGWHNAEVYEAFTREHGIYRALNRRLADLAEIDTAARVLDLACGAGATALACLERMPARSELVGVDGSEEMVAVARDRVRDPRARFRVAAASALERVTAGPFDRAVCNAAFWQFPDPGSVLAALARILAPGGCFVFNVPAERLASEPSEPAAGGPSHLTPFQVALARAVERRTRDPFPGHETLDPDRLEVRLGEAGFEAVERHPFAYRGRQRELMELMTIPAMIDRVAPDLGESERAAALDEARRHTDPDQRVVVPWVYFVARRSGR